MKKTVNCILLVLLLLPFVGTISNENNNINVLLSESPISSVNSGGLGKVWDIEWRNGTHIVDYCSHFWVMNDSVYIVGTISQDDASDCFFLVKFSQNGSIVWEKISQEGGSIGAYIWGDKDAIYTLHEDGYGRFVTKWNSNGTSVWAQSIGGRYPIDFKGQNESLYVLTSEYMSKWDSNNGTMVWEKSIPSDYDNKFVISNDSIYVFCGKGSYPDEKICFYKYSFNGTLVWQKEHYYNTEELCGIFEENAWVDNNYIYVVGSKGGYSPHSLFLIKFSHEGEFIWEQSIRYLEDTTMGRSVFLSSSEEIYVGGGTTYSGRFLLAGLNQEGDVLWSKTWEELLYGDSYIEDIQGYEDGIYTLGKDGPAFVLTKWVKDVNSPTLTALEDVQYEQTDSMSTLSWYAYDENPDSYNIYKDGYEIESGDWISGEAIEIQIDKSSVLRQYNYSIVVRDLSEGIATDSLIVTIEDTVAPIIFGSYSNETSKIVWVAEDRNPDSYDVYKGEELVSSGSWVSGGDISVVADVPDEGFYNYTVVIRDSSGNINSNSIIISASASSPDDDDNDNDNNDGDDVVAPFPWMIVLLIIIGIAIIAVTMIVIILIRKKQWIIREKVYIKN